jgi:hypothetical protein
MKTYRLNTRAVLGAYVALAVVAGSLAAACGDDADGDDPNVIPSTGGKSGSGGGNAAGESSAGAGNEPGTGGSGGSDSGTGGAASETGGADGGGGEAGGGTEPGVGGSGGEGGGGEANCEPQGEYNCYPCAPETDEQYLNRCSDAECSPFDNADRIPGFTGTLPDL